jgi:hypothetical protein
MDSDWKLLIQLGLPKGAAHRVEGDIFSKARESRNAVHSLSNARLASADIDVLAAWLSAFKHHFPSAFSEVLGSVGEDCLSQLRPNVDPDRYLKLRRIALSNLASLL